ncbi:hypothetical protein [Paraliomyxa miuraensis]|uniref:hypothetical protein n=1 Tax=Paraliomyxa miuraensis TaxID=376150 RepID=UPI00224CCEFA|nr:hypothetical protein [Paraliomyxa miuraensis]MCX4241613.1 hypothetical protein [Paraliomyxa miuraensis]
MISTLDRCFRWVSALVCPAALLGVLGGSGCQQPDLNCTVYHGTYAAKYELESGDPTSVCGSLPGDVLGLNAYYADAGGRPDLEQGSIAIRPRYVNALIFHALEQGVTDLSMDEDAQSVGDFSAGRPGADDFCEAPTLSEATITIPEVPEVPDDPETPDEDESAPLQPATTISYDWSNVRVLVNADAQGTQFSADLHFEQDGCAARYHVIAMYPAVGCTSDEDCANAGSINPGFSTECSPGLGLCVLTDEPPSYE